MTRRNDQVQQNNGESTIMNELAAPLNNGLVAISRLITRFKTGLAQFPAGTVFQVSVYSRTAYFKALPCKCCGLQFKNTAKDKDKFFGATWLGYYKPVAN